MEDTLQCKVAWAGGNSTGVELMGWVVSAWRPMPPAGTWQAEGCRGPCFTGLSAGQDGECGPTHYSMLLPAGMSVGTASSSPTTK